jgi:hypothetical protein
MISRRPHATAGGKHCLLDASARPTMLGSGTRRCRFARMVAQSVVCLFAGAFLCNCVPHLASGLQGRSFPTPFSKPRGVGDSSALVNVLWGFFNLLAGVSLLSIYPVLIGVNLAFLSLVAGALLFGVGLALHFEQVRRG